MAEQRGPKVKAQFQYWNLKRKGIAQAKVSKMLGITRQAVSRSVKLQEGEVLGDLTEFAGASGIAIEWTDPVRGIMTGFNPQIGNVSCIMVVDDRGKIRLFYDQARNRDQILRRKLMADLRRILKESCIIYVDTRAPFREILEKVMGG